MAVSEIPATTIAAVQSLMGNKYAQLAAAICGVLLIGLVIFGVGISIWREEPLNPIISTILTFLLGSGSTLVGAQHGVSTAMQAVTAQTTVQNAVTTSQSNLVRAVAQGMANNQPAS